MIFSNKNINVKVLMQSYNTSQGLHLSVKGNYESEEPKKSNRKNKKSSSNYIDNFKVKYANLSKTIDDFKTKDLLYLFRQVAYDSGNRYVIANFAKDMHIFKKLQENYTPREIWNMIDFVYNSEQNYMDRSNFSPNILVSSWCNTLFNDSQKYIKGEYIPLNRSKKSKKGSQLTRREWSNNSDNSTKGKKIGEW